MGKDMLSNLPDEILGRIVSFLPNESALETSLLSTRWRDLWNEVLVRHGTEEDIIGVVAGFMTRFEEVDPLKHPRKLQFHFAEEGVVSATVANNNKLMLEFSPWKEELQMGYYELVFNLSKQQNITTYQCFPFTFSVKTLYLKSVSSFTSEVATSIISNLDHLENLVIIHCKGLQTLSIDSTSELHKLTILDCLELKSLHLKTSKLKSFRYRGPLPLIRPEYHFNLSDAMLDFRLGFSCSGLKTKDFDATLLTIKNSEVLTLCRWTFEELIWPSISPLSGSFRFYKLRELWWIDNYEYNMDALFFFLKLCPSLEQLFVTIDPESYSAGRSNSCSMKGTKCTELENLKLIKFMGFTSRKDEISLAKCLIHLIKGKPPNIKSSDGSCLDAMFVQ
ncbi:F-box protein At2g39490 [Cajanus cajan]|uniref:F-box protein At2g39490 family n=1 Tax=Cajanus cajan TaxID=3821 RepID=A0A151S7K5_CAJCA|nr:F-box protein At2g39490 [Cajanus cajan]KYP50748.1 F-box protein At2g39490 family [Cajanus cajan]